MGKLDNLRPWVAGQSGNPNGRPKGSKHKLSEEFLAALAADFEEHGAAVIARVREEEPDRYLKVVAPIPPKDINVSTNPFDEEATRSRARHPLHPSCGAWKRVGAHRVAQSPGFH